MTDRVKAAAKAELQAHLAYWEAKRKADEARDRALMTEAIVRDLYAKYQAAVVERNQAVVEMYANAPEAGEPVRE